MVDNRFTKEIRIYRRLRHRFAVNPLEEVKEACLNYNTHSSQSIIHQVIADMPYTTIL